MSRMNSSWENVAKKYARKIGNYGDINHRKYLNPIILRIIGNVKGKKILDLACGQGYFARIITRKGAKVTGIDISSSMINMAKDNEKEYTLGISYLLENSYRMKRLRNKTFDIIISNVSFHDIDDIKKTIKECSRVLKSEGRLLFSIVHPIRSRSVRSKAKDGYCNKMYGYLNQTRVTHPMFPRRKDVGLYHRPIGLYIKELVKNGFLVSRFDEIATFHSKGNIVSDSKLIKYNSEFPLFLTVEAVKYKIKESGTTKPF